MGALVQTDIGVLLEMAGARIRGRNRADCPDCKRPRAVSFNETAFCCHGIDCHFHGGPGTLRQRLGIERQWLPKAEYARQCRERKRGSEAARRLHHAAKVRRFALYDELRTLARIEVGAHDCGPTGAAWSALALVYSERRRILAELAIFENANAAGLARFLTADDAARQAPKESAKAETGKVGRA